MPVYTYKCQDCGTRSDQFHSFTEELTEPCDCGGKLSKVLSLSGVAFKGNGFYKNDAQTNRPKE